MTILFKVHTKDPLMFRTLTPLLSVALLFGCASAAPTPEAPVPDSPEKVAVNEAPKPFTPTQVFALREQRSFHLNALNMSAYIATDVLSHRPCGVTYSSKDKNWKRRLMYDDMKRLTKSIETRTTPESERKTVVEMSYNDQGYPLTINYKNFIVMKYEYKDGVLSEFNTFNVKGVDLEPKLLSTVSFETDTRSITFTNATPNSKPETAVMKYDEQDRVISHRLFGEPDEIKDWWRYVANDPNPASGTIERGGGRRFSATYKHTINDGSLVRTIKTYDEKTTDRVYTYNDGKLVSAKTVEFGTDNVVDTLTYTYTCQ